MRTYIFPANLKTVDVPGHDDEPAASGHMPTWIRPSDHHKNNYFIRDRG
jgi:hypothetical protein